MVRQNGFYAGWHACLVRQQDAPLHFSTIGLLGVSHLGWEKFYSCKQVWSNLRQTQNVTHLGCGIIQGACHLNWVPCSAKRCIPDSKLHSGDVKFSQGVSGRRFFTASFSDLGNIIRLALINIVCFNEQGRGSL